MTTAALPLVSRDREVAALRAALAATAAGTGGCLVLTGPAGIGKTRLVDLAVAEAAGAGIAVAPGRATELDRVAPLTTLVTALQRCRPDVIDLSDLREHDADRFWYIDRLGQILEDFVAKRPLLVAIDDAQWADEFSVLALRSLVPALASSPLRWLFARRSVPPSAVQDTIDWLIEESAEQVHLGPLDDEGVSQLCSHALGATADATVLALATRGGGNPFLLEQWLGALRSAGQILINGGTATVVGDELPSVFLSAVDQRLRGLSVAARRLLQAGAIFGRPFTLHAAASLAGGAALELMGAADEALGAGVLVEDDTRLTFAHDLLRQAVYNHLPGPARAAMHREAAAVVRAEGCSAAEIADHLLRSGETGDRAAVDVLGAAAAEVAGRAPGTAADLLVRAVGLLGDDDPERARLSADAVGLLASAARLAEATELGGAALQARLDPPTEARLLLGLAESLKHAGDNQAAVEYARRGLAVPGVPDAIRAGLHAIAAHALLYVGDMAGADRAGAEARRLGQAAHEFSATVFGDAARSVVARADGRLDDALEHARHAVDLADEVGGEARHRHPRIWLGGALAAIDRLDEARLAYSVGRKEADRLGTAWSQPLWHFYHASASTGMGLLDEAVAEAEAGVRIAEQLTARQLAVPLLGLLSRLAVVRGQLPLAREHLRRMRRLVADGITAAPEDVVWTIAVLQDAEGKPELAMSTLAELYDDLPQRLLLLTNDPGCAPALVRIALAAGSRARAEATVGAARYLTERNPGVASLAGAAAHAEGLLRTDIEALRLAVQCYRDSPRPLARAAATADAAEAEYRAGSRGRAVELLESALDEYSRCGARQATTRLERQLKRLGSRRRPADPPAADASPLAGLSEAERPVAALVAQGLTNRAVAERLFLSHHTVDSHLRHIFDKLSIKSRVELARLVAGHAADIA